MIAIYNFSFMKWDILEKISGQMKEQNCIEERKPITCWLFLRNKLLQDTKDVFLSPRNPFSQFSVEIRWEFLDFCGFKHLYIWKENNPGSFEKSETDASFIIVDHKLVVLFVVWSYLWL